MRPCRYIVQPAEHKAPNPVQLCVKRYIQLMLNQIDKFHTIYISDNFPTRIRCRSVQRFSQNVSSFKTNLIRLINETINQFNNKPYKATTTFKYA